MIELRINRTSAKTDIPRGEAAAQHPPHVFIKRLIAEDGGEFHGRN